MKSARALPALCAATFLSFSLTGCMLDLDEDLDDGIWDEDRDDDADLGKADAPRNLLGNPTSRLTLYSEPDFSGDRLTITLTHGDSNERRRLVTRSELEDANLLDRASSLRLQCGDRSAQVLLFAWRNNSSTIAGWNENARGEPVYCSPGQTISWNLHVHAPAYADKVGSVYFLSHADNARTDLFSSHLRDAWEEGLADLGSGSRAQGPLQLRMTSEETFRIRQALRLNHWSCRARDAEIELAVIMRQNGTFFVSRKTWVAYGTGDAWGCRTKMQDALTAGAKEVADELSSGLAELVDYYAGSSPRRYFVPDERFTDFWLGHGGPTPPLDNLHH
jgi:hypothetical protein